MPTESAARPCPRDRVCKRDGEPITYDPHEDVWARSWEIGGWKPALYQYGVHSGSCGRRLVLLRVTPGDPPFHRRQVPTDE